MRSPPPPERQSPARDPEAQPPAAERPDAEAAKPKPAVERGKVYVVVFNNSCITGLAGTVAAQAAAAGWQVVGSDNWYGTIPATTVYYPRG